MKTLFLLLFINCLCNAQPRIKSLDDIPTSDKDKCIQYGKLILSKLQTLPDTINNEWEKYTLRYVNREERGFYADDNWIKFEAEPWYFDSIAYHKQTPSPDFIEIIRLSACKNNLNTESWSYDGTFKLTTEELINTFRRSTDSKLYDSLSYIIPNYNGVDIEWDDDFFVIEKTIRTKKHQIIHQLLAIAPRYTILDKVTGDPRGRKLLCWFVLK